MPSIIRHTPGLAALLAVVFVAACGPAAPKGGTVEIDISQVFGGEPLQLVDKDYETASGDALKITKLRYYLSNIRLRRHDDQWYTQPLGAKDGSGYYLVDAAKPQSLKLRLPDVTSADYEALEFLIGVDAARSDQGAQSGALDPLNGMFWTWSSGYIFFQLEGLRPDGSELSWHVGGRGPDAPARTVQLPLGEKPLQVKPQLLSTIHLQADIAEIFRTPQTLDHDALTTAMDAKSATPIADNYADIFRVDHLHHEPLRR